jgi:hypothetical protein
VDQVTEIRALLIWANGYREYQIVRYPLLPVWTIRLHEPESNMLTMDPDTIPILKYRELSFRLVRYSDRSFEYREVP